MSLILPQLAAGDTSAVGRCIDEYGGLVHGLAQKYLRGNKAEVEDGVQEIFVSIWLSAERFDPARGSEAAFVATIAHRRLTDIRRRIAARQKHTARVEAAGDTPAPPTPADMQKLGEEFAGLPSDERDALWMVVSRGLTHRQIAEATSVPVGTVKSRLRRAVMRLQQAFGSVDEKVRVGSKAGPST